jgi:hypothetical protein
MGHHLVRSSTKYAEALERKLAQLEQAVVRLQLTDENFTDLMEEGVRQAARSVSDERREYIASIVANSLSTDDIAFQESKHLLRILGELNDIEVLWLRFYREPTFAGDTAFRERHGDVFQPVAATFGSSQPTVDKGTLQESYRDHLVQLGLLERRYRIDRRTKLPEFDSNGAMRVQGYALTPLGLLLLRHIGLGEGDDANG